jgi:serine protease Do
MDMSGTFLSGPAERLRPSVVGIANGRRGAGRGAAGGAGIAWSGDLFVTSAHVATASHATIVTPDGRAVPGDVVRRDAERDIAVIRAPGAAVAAAITGDPYALRSGSLVFAVGHPFGVRDAISVGVLQAVSRLPRGYGLNGKGSLVWIQADVRLAPGNSGGPVADAQGRVIGVAAMVVSGVALAVPVPDIERFLSGLT